MADKVEYSRLLIKRSDNSGIVPTIPTGSTLSTFVDTDTFVGEFFLNSTDDRLWVRTDNGQFEIMMSGNTSGNTQNLGQTLGYGNETLGNNIVMSQDDRIYAFTGDTYIEFNKVTDPLIKLYSGDLINGSSNIGVTPQDLSIGYNNTGTTVGQIGIDNNSLDMTFTDGSETSTLSMTPSIFTLDTTFGNIQSKLELDPEQANNGTQLRTEDVVNNTFGLVLVRDSDVLIEVSNPSTSKQSSLSITDDNTQMISELYFQGYNGVGFWTKGESYTTTGAGATIIHTLDTTLAPFGNDKIYKIICHYTALYDTYASGMTTEVRGTFINNGGTITQIGSVEYFGTRNGSGITSLPDFTITGSDINLRVRGVAITNIDWSVIINIQTH